MPRFQAGAALPVTVTTGGRVANEAATPIAVVAGGPVIAQRARRVQLVTSGPVKDQAAIPVVNMGAGAVYSDEPPLLVYVVSGSLGTTYTQKVQAMLPGNLIGYWPQAETSGVTAFDESGNGRNGTYRNTAGVLNGVTLGNSGIYDGRTAAGFDGTNGYDNIYSASLAGAFNNAEGTIAGWMQISAAGVWTDGAFRVPLTLRADANNVVVIQKSSTNNTLQWVYIAGGTNKTVTKSSFSPVAWQHVALTWSKSADQMKAYLNGVQEGATQTGLGTWSGALASSGVNIGCRTNTVPDQCWSGTLAHWAIWTTPLSAAQIAVLATP